MRVDKKKSAYSRMYLVTPSVYEKLKKCIDDYDKAELSKINLSMEDTDDHSKSNDVIRNISSDEIMTDVSTNKHDSNTHSSNQSFFHPHNNASHLTPPLIRTSTHIHQPTNKLPGNSLKIPDLGTIPEEEFDVEDSYIEPTYQTAQPPETFLDNTLDESFKPPLNSTTILSDARRHLPQSHTNKSIDESYQPIPGPSRQKESLFAKKQSRKKNIIPNFPVNPPEIENGRYIIHPADADITWIDQTDNTDMDANTSVATTFNPPSFASSGRDSIHYSDANISQPNQGSSRNVTVSSQALSNRSRPSFVVKRPLQPNLSVKTRTQKRNACDSILPLKKCRIQVNAVNDNNTSLMKDISKPTKFVCHICGKKYTYKYSLNRHISNIHKLTHDDFQRLTRPPQLAIEYIQDHPNIPPSNSANESWIKPGKRTDTQAGFRKRRDDKYKRIMTVGLKRNRKTANLDDSRKVKPDRTFKNWKI